MNREIKFRAKCLITKKFKVGYYVKDYSATSYITSLDGEDTAVIDDDTVGQFTGLKDKNGKDIYEGDILRRGEDVSFVVWQLDHWCLNSYMQVGRGLYANVDKTRHKDFEIAEVIGNIHETPELLK